MHYIVLVIFFTLLADKRKAGIIAFIFSTMTLVLFAFFTKEGSWDYYGYIDYYKCSIAPDCDSTGFEKSFSYISQISNFISNNWGLELTFLTYIIASLAIKIYLIKTKSKAFGIAILTFICQAYFIHDLTQIRASLAIAILWLAFSHWTERKIVRGLGLILLAAFFHISALMGLLIVFLERLSTKWLLILTIPAALLGQYLANGGITSLPALPIDRLDIYISAIGSAALTASQFNVYVMIIALVAFVGYKNGLNGWSRLERLGINSMLFGVVIYLSSYFIPIVPVRLLEFFSLLYPFVAAATYSSSQSRVEKISLVIGFLALFTNTAIRNNTRLDLWFPWQAINYEYMTDLQLEQFMQMAQ